MAPEKIGRYEIIKELGRGGMADVFLAHDPQFDRQVAVKVMPAELMRDSSFLARFQREAKTIANLQHPSIVPVFDYGEEGNQPYLVMRYMQGGSLAGRVSPDKPLTLEETSRILSGIASALDKAHAVGIIHRDLKPSNVLFDEDGHAYLADFGIAKLAEATAALTIGVIGTPEYMSPEQGQGKEELDGRSDVYSLGVVAYQLLTGRLPYQADTPLSIIYAHVHEPLPDVLMLNPALPKGIKTILEKALAKDRAERYTTSQEFTAALAAVREMPVAQAAREIRAAPQTAVLEMKPQTLPPEKKALKSPLPKGRKESAPSQTKTSGVPLWTWLGGGAVLLALVILAIRQFSSPALPDITLVGEREQIAFTSDRDGNTEIYVMDVDGSNPTRLTVSQENLSRRDATDISPNWSPDRSRIVFVAHNKGNAEIMVMAADGSSLINISSNIASDVDPAWSPDGSRIAFRSNRDGNSEIYIMSATGEYLIRLTENDASDFSPDWSPDGRRIAFVSTRDGNPEIYVMDADGSRQIRLTGNPAADVDPAWSPDGRKIAFTSSRDGASEIYIMEANGDNQTRLTENTDLDSNPTWSPDGEHIAFESFRDDNFEIYVMKADGSDQTRLTENAVAEGDPAWSP